MDSSKDRAYAASLADVDDESIVHASVLTSSFMVPMVLNAAIELDILEIIHKAGPGARLSARQIVSNMAAAQNANAASAVDRMLRLLASYSIVICTLRALEDGKVERLYGLARVGRLFVKIDEEGGSMTGFLTFSQHRAILDMRHLLKDAVLEGGIPFKVAHGTSAYEYMKTDPLFSKAFNTAVSYHSSIVMKRILEVYKGFDSVTLLVDVGGGRGATLHSVVSKYPHIEGINFDLPQVLKDAPAYEGIQHVGGNMFEAVPKGSAILLKRVLHNWTDEKCLKLLRNCYKALATAESAAGGKVIVIESIWSEEGRSSVTDKYVALYDSIMFTQHEGKERTESEFEALARGAGFSGFRVVCCACAHSVMELTIYD